MSAHKPTQEPSISAAAMDAAAHSQSSAATAARQGRMAAIFLMLVGVAVIAGAIIWSQRSTRAPSLLPQVGRPLSDFRLNDLDGQQVRLTDFLGQPVLINFWATWCPPCRQEMPDLQALLADQRDSGLVILSINSGEPRAIAAGFASEYGLNFPVLLDEDFALSDQWLINNLPTTILVGRDGLVKVIHVGLFSPSQMQRELLPHLRQN